MYAKHKGMAREKKNCFDLSDGELSRIRARKDHVCVLLNAVRCATHVLTPLSVTEDFIVCKRNLWMNSFSLAT